MTTCLSVPVYSLAAACKHVACVFLKWVKSGCVGYEHSEGGDAILLDICLPVLHRFNGRGEMYMISFVSCFNLLNIYSIY